jgi:ribosomal protein L16 Arg81 hydroxylase
MVTSAHTGNDAYITAYNNVANTVALQPLMGDFGPVPFLDERIGSIWIGPKGTFTPLHHDLNNNLLVQLMGTKRLFLLPPEETSKLANTDFVFSDVHDIMSDEKVAQYPEVLSARCYHVDIHPGDALFMPVGWWHQVEALSFSAMLTYHNFIWPNDAFRDFPPNR